MAVATVVALLAMCFAPSVAGAGWSPTQIVSGAGTSISNTQIAGASNGRSIVAWTRFIPGADKVQATLIAANGTPGPVLTLSSGILPAANLQVEMDENGNSVVAWVRSNGLNNIVQSVTVSASGTVGTVVNRSAAGQNADHPRIGLTDTGAYTLVWRRFSGANFIAQSQTVSATGSAAAVKNLSPVGSNSLDPDVAALPDGTYKASWAKSAAALSNIGYVAIAADGTPGEVAFAFPVQDPTTMAPSGVDGNPREVNVVSTSAGAATIVWIRDITIETEGQPPVTKRGIESIQLSDIGLPSATFRISPTTYDVSQPNLTVNGTKIRVAWTAEVGGQHLVESIGLGATGRLGFLQRVSGDVGTSGFPAVGVSSGGWATVAWFRPTATPGITTAQAARISPTGQLFDPVDLSSATAKSADNPQVFVTPAGEPAVAMNASDAANVVTSRIVRFTDPGVAINPATQQFGKANLNMTSRTRSFFITNPGSTPSTITGISLGGTNPGQFQLSDASSCLISLSPAGNCEIQATFAPTAAGSQQADIEVTSEGGNDSSQISGTGVAQTRLNFKIRPTFRKVRRGRTTKVKAVVKNSGGLKATSVKVCFNATPKAFKPKKKCSRANSLGVGRSRTVKFRIRVKNRARRNKVYRVNLRATAGNASHRRNTIKVKAK
ncbi:MAG: choice-of-anchor D domain-containing protein [Thermoleophilia bacterium]|nr:choice-of-anchor D domain-containing protein [Thermoleophilia bacterium]